MRFLTSVIVATCLLATAALALTDLDGVVEILKAQGFETVEVVEEGDRIVLTARGSGLFRELVYSSETGAILSDDVRVIAPENGLTPDGEVQEESM